MYVEDEVKIASFVCAGLKEQGFVVDYCDHGDEGYLRAMELSYDAIVLDIMLPGKDGMAILKGMRRAGLNTPVILLTARNELDDRLEGLNLGSDDYIAKPFFVEELVARIHAVVRRVSGERQNLLKVGLLQLDRISREVTCNQQSVELTTREFNLLEYLMRSPGRVFTRTQILEHVWGYDFNPDTNLVDVCIQRIRKKIDPLAILQGELERTLHRAKPGSELQQNLSKLLDEVGRLKGIIRKLLLLSLADAGKMRFTLVETDLSTLLLELVDDIDMLAPELEVQVEIAPDLRASIDRDLLIPVLYNLITNAIKYNQPDGWLNVHARYQGDTVAVTIHNKSLDLSPLDQQQIFERFYRSGANRHSQIEGVGLGLALSREIARGHGGDLKLDKTSIGSTAFTLTLPKPLEKKEV